MPLFTNAIIKFTTDRSSFPIFLLWDLEQEFLTCLSCLTSKMVIIMVSAAYDDWQGPVTEYPLDTYYLIFLISPRSWHLPIGNIRLHTTQTFYQQVHGGSGLLIRVRTRAWESLTSLCVSWLGDVRDSWIRQVIPLLPVTLAVCKPPGSVLETICDPGKRDIGSGISCSSIMSPEIGQAPYSLPSSLTACWVGKLWSTLPGLDLLWDVSHPDLQSFHPFQ